MKQYDYLVVGSGIAGAVFTYEAAKRNKSCLVLERRSHIGGNVFCESIEGIRVHRYGAHIFHTSDKNIWEYINNFSEFNNYINCPVANYNGEIYNLPFNMNTFSKMWNISTPAQAAAIVEKQRAEFSGTHKNLEERAIGLVGRDIFEKLIKGYTEKQWGKPCRELPPSIIERVPVRYTYDNNYFSDRFQGIPINGYNAIVEKMLSGCDVLLGVDYNEDRDKYNRIVGKIVYTGMIDEYFDYQLGHLEYRSLRFEHEVLDKTNHQGVAVVNYTDAQTPYTRVIEHKHFEFGTQAKTVISREYPMKWTPGEEAYYPVNDEKNQILYHRYQELAKKESSVLFIGRLAEYKYYDMDDVIISVLDAAERELDGKVADNCRS